MALSKEWNTLVSTLSGAAKGTLKTIFTSLIAQLTVLELQLNINSLRTHIEIQIQTVILGVANSALSTAQTLVSPVTNIFQALPKGQTSEGIQIPSSIPEISQNTQSLTVIIQKPNQVLEDAKSKLNKLKLYAAAHDGKKNQLSNQISLLQEQVNSL